MPSGNGSGKSSGSNNPSQRSSSTPRSSTPSSTPQRSSSTPRSSTPSSGNSGGRSVSSSSSSPQRSSSTPRSSTPSSSSLRSGMGSSSYRSPTQSGSGKTSLPSMSATQSGSGKTSLPNTQYSGQGKVSFGGPSYSTSRPTQFTGGVSTYRPGINPQSNVTFAGKGINQPSTPQYRTNPSTRFAARPDAGFASPASPARSIAAQKPSGGVIKYADGTKVIYPSKEMARQDLQEVRRGVNFSNMTPQPAPLSVALRPTTEGTLNRYNSTPRVDRAAQLNGAGLATRARTAIEASRMRGDIPTAFNKAKTDLPAQQLTRNLRPAMPSVPDASYSPSTAAARQAMAAPRQIAPAPAYQLSANRTDDFRAPPGAPKAPAPAILRYPDGTVVNYASKQDAAGDQREIRRGIALGNMAAFEDDGAYDDGPVDVGGGVMVNADGTPAGGVPGSGSAYRSLRPNVDPATGVQVSPINGGAPSYGGSEEINSTDDLYGGVEGRKTPIYGTPEKIARIAGLGGLVDAANWSANLPSDGVAGKTSRDYIDGTRSSRDEGALGILASTLQQQADSVNNPVANPPPPTPPTTPVVGAIQNAFRPPIDYYNYGFKPEQQMFTNNSIA